MARYIDADKLFRYVDEQTHLSKGKLQNYIRENVTTDIVEVVRCKDCKHFIVGYCCRDIKGRSQMHYMGEEAFCSYGERS